MLGVHSPPTFKDYDPYLSYVKEADRKLPAWCKHMLETVLCGKSVGGRVDHRYTRHHYCLFDTHDYAQANWAVCPICATPRPSGSDDVEIKA